jgi:hypothetical protein
MRQLALLSLLLASAFGQTSPVPYSGGPGFSNERFLHSYPGTYSSIRKVDFRNFSFFGFEPIGGVSLRNGRFKHDGPHDVQSVDLDSVHWLGQPPASQGESALVLLSWYVSGGSASVGEAASVFTLSGNHLLGVQEIGWDTQFQSDRPPESFDATTNTLVIRAAHYIPGDGHCCVTAVDVVTFRWDGARFVQTGIQTELSEYGKKEGKILPTAVSR